MTPTMRARAVIVGSLRSRSSSVLPGDELQTLVPDGRLVDTERLGLVRRGRPDTNVESVVRRAAAVAGLTTTVVSGVAATVGALSGGLLLIPAGVILGMTLIYGAASHRIRAKTALDLLREEYLAALDEAAVEFETRFRASVALVGESLVQSTRELLERDQAQIAFEAIDLERLLSAPESREAQAVVLQLKPICRAGDQMISVLDTLVRECRPER